MRHIRSPCGKWYFPYRPLEIFLNLNRKLMYLREERKQSPKPKTFPQAYEEVGNSIFSYWVNQEVSLGERPDTNDLH